MLSQAFCPLIILALNEMTDKPSRFSPKKVGQRIATTDLSDPYSLLPDQTSLTLNQI